MATRTRTLEKTRRIKIVADGLDPHSARVIDAKTGEQINAVVSVDVQLRPNEIPRAQLVIQDFDLEVEAEAEVSVKEELGAPL